MNTEVNKALSDVAEVAGILCEKNYTEAKGGNLSVNISGMVDPMIIDLVPKHEAVILREAVPLLEGNIIYVTATGSRMRDVAKSAWKNGVIIRIISNGSMYEVISNENISPTSELSSHLGIHAQFVANKSENKAVLHTHPAELIALSHCIEYLDEEYLSKRLWSMMPETRVFVPKGIGLIPYEITGSTELARSTMKKLQKYDVVIWEKHGVLSVGEDLQSCLDILEILTKSARILLIGKAAGLEPQGLSEKQMDELAKAFSL